MLQAHRKGRGNMPDFRVRSLVGYCTWEEDGEFKASLGCINKFYASLGYPTSYRSTWVHSVFQASFGCMMKHCLQRGSWDRQMAQVSPT